jgi:hypothetical protein
MRPDEDQAMSAGASRRVIRRFGCRHYQPRTKFRRNAPQWERKSLSKIRECRTIRLIIRAIFAILVISDVTLTSLEAHSASQYHQGATLLRDCENSDPLKQLPCSAYIEGVSDALLATEGLLSAPCYPAGGVQAGQLSLVVVQFLRAHPERLYEGGARLVQEALNGAFPCTARDSVAYPGPTPGAPSR